MKAHPLGGQGPRWKVEFHPAAEADLLALPFQLQRRFLRAFDALAVDPWAPRPGVDLKKIGDLGTAPLYRLRVGEYRSCYVILTSSRRALVLLLEPRARGYSRILSTAFARGRRLL